MAPLVTYHCCACGYEAPFDKVIEHVRHMIREGDKRPYQEGGHAIMLRARREQQEQAKS